MERNRVRTDERRQREAAGRDVPADAAARLPALHFSTHLLPASDQFEAWRAFSTAAVDISLAGGPAPGFPAEQAVWDLGSLAFTSATMPGAGYVRSWRHWEREPIDHWCLVVCEGATHGDGRSPAGARGPVGFRSLARPFEGRGEDWKVLSLFVPRDLFPAAAARFDAVPGHLPPAALTLILADYLASLERRLPHLSAAEVPAVLEATRALLLACLAPSADALAEARAPLAFTLRERARRHVRANLRDPGLSPETLAGALGLSRSALYRLFEDMGGVVRYIQRQRLRVALDHLCDVGTPPPVARVAAQVGFADASSFSRAFRGEFGFSPSEARAAAGVGRLRAGQLPAAMPPPAFGAARTLGDVLRRLRA